MCPENSERQFRDIAYQLWDFVFWDSQSDFVLFEYEKKEQSKISGQK